MPDRDMSIDPAAPTPFAAAPTPGVVATQRSTGPGPAGRSSEVLLAETPAPVTLEPGPTDDALTAVQIAADAYEMLRRSDRELRFQADDGIMRIEVYDGTGALIRTIPPNEALAIATGEPSWLA